MGYLAHARGVLAYQERSTDKMADSQLFPRVADSYWLLGKYQEAEKMQRQALKLRKEIFGTEHPDTLMSMNNLATSLADQGKYDEAEQIYRQTLELREKILGTKHPDTLRSMNNFTTTLVNQGN